MLLEEPRSAALLDVDVRRSIQLKTSCRCTPLMIKVPIN